MTGMLLSFYHMGRGEDGWDAKPNLDSVAGAARRSPVLRRKPAVERSASSGLADDLHIHEGGARLGAHNAQSPSPSPKPKQPQPRNSPADPPLPSQTSDLDAPLDAPARPPPRPKVVLPGLVLVVDDDLERAAHTAVKLLAFGYTCRVSSFEEAPRVLNEQSFDALYEELSPETSASLPWSGPRVLSGPRRPQQPFSGAFVPRPWVTQALVRALERARSEGAAPVPAPSRRAAEAVASDRSERKSTEGRPMERERSNPGESVGLLHKVVRARVSEGHGFSAARVLLASYGGSMQLETARAMVPSDGWSVELNLADGRQQRFAARHRGEGRFSLRMSALEVPFFHIWVDEARDPKLTLSPVTLEREADPDTDARTDLDEMWEAARTRLDDDAAQQRFIQSCVRSQSLEFAVSRYRALKEQGEERAEKYLTQVGTILGFYALRQTSANQGSGGLSKQLKVILGLFMLAAAVLVVLANFAR